MRMMLCSQEWASFYKQLFELYDLVVDGKVNIPNQTTLTETKLLLELDGYYHSRPDSI